MIFHNWYQEPGARDLGLTKVVFVSCYEEKKLIVRAYDDLNCVKRVFTGMGLFGFGTKKATEGFLSTAMFILCTAMLLVLGFKVTAGKDWAKITKKQSKPDKIEHDIEKIAQKPDQRIFSV
nr:hypothetical protein [Tanacetum cinerariifolium]